MLVEKKEGSGHKHRVYLYEVDLMRCFFMLSVLATHVTSHYTDAFVNGSHSHELMLASHMMLHYARYGFMFISGLVLFLVYYNRKIHLKKFWVKHIGNIGIPYVFWMGVFLLITMLLFHHDDFTWNNWLLNWFNDVIYAKRFYLYYLYVTMQFYLVFPLLVWLFKKTEGHHNLVLAIAAIIQMAMLFYVKYVYPTQSHAGWPFLLKYYGNNVFFYEYYFVLGGYVWIHYDAVKKWIRKYRYWIYSATVLLSLGTIPLYLFNARVMNFGRHLSQLAHQPYIMIYSTSIILSVISISLKYAEVRTKPKWQGFAKLVSLTSTLSFGIYLTQTAPIILLDHFLTTVNVFIPSWQLLIMLPFGLLFVIAGAWLISYFCFKVPPFGILIGRPNWKRVKK